MSRPGQMLDAIQRLKSATRDLQQQWTDTRLSWNDDAADRFEAKHLNSILPTLRIVVAATSELDELYRKAIQQCRDKDRGDSLF